MDQRYLDDARSALEEERAHVESQLAEYGATDGEAVEVPVDEGFADSALATMERSELLSLVEQLLEQRREIVAALGRIDAGTYGRCERCGEVIAPERLEALRTARLCLPCKQASAA